MLGESEYLWLASQSLQFLALESETVRFPITACSESYPCSCIWIGFFITC